MGFKVGDKVRVVRACDDECVGCTENIGQEFEIMDIFNDDDAEFGSRPMAIMKDCNFDCYLDQLELAVAKDNSPLPLPG